jgi:O-acetyl-ADP-ribose deacetylase (regulator of RNase III)
METRIDQAVLELVQGDITTLDTDAIVNAANRGLAHGGGVAAAIARAGGPVIQRESTAWVRKHGEVPTGSAAITSGGDLKAEYVIHAVGPVYNASSPVKAAEDLASAVWAALRVAEEHDLRSIALPAISTGIYGYPPAEAAGVMLKAAIDYITGGTSLERIVFCLYGESTFNIFVNALEAAIGGHNQVPGPSSGRQTAA